MSRRAAGSRRRSAGSPTACSPTARGSTTRSSTPASARTSSTEIMKAILARDEAAARLIPALESGFEPLDRNKQVNGPFLDAMADALGPFVTEREAVQATLERAPATLSAAEDGLRRGEALLSAVRELLERRRRDAARTRPRAFTTSPRSCARARPRSGARCARSSSPRRERSDSATCSSRSIPVSKHIQRGAEAARPILRHIGKYGCDTINAAAVLRSMTGFAQAGDAYTGPNGPAMAFRLEALPAYPLRERRESRTRQVQRDAYERSVQVPLRALPAARRPGGGWGRGREQAPAGVAAADRPPRPDRPRRGHRGHLRRPSQRSVQARPLRGRRRLREGAPAPRGRPGSPRGQRRGRGDRGRTRSDAGGGAGDDGGRGGRRADLRRRQRPPQRQDPARRAPSTSPSTAATKQAGELGDKIITTRITPPSRSRSRTSPTSSATAPSRA